VETLRLSGGWQLFPGLYNALAEALRREIAVDWGNALTLAKLGRCYFRNALRNLALIPGCPSIGALSFGAEPALVLGAGPSLDPLLEGLAARFGETLKNPLARPFKIVCVDTCLPALRERNIRPDLAVILESQHWNLRDFIGSLNWDVPAAMDLSALPATGRILSGGVYLFVTAWTELRLFERLGAAGLLPARLPPLGSVGLCAMELARRISRGTIIAGGIDFSFTLDSYHARSTPGHADKLRRHNRFHSLLNAPAVFGPASFSAVSKSGLSVWSNPAMRGYRSLFEQEFAADARLFDISGSGLPLGIPALPLEAAFNALETGGGARAAREEGPAKSSANHAGKLAAFLEEEKIRLTKLRSILTGEAPAEGLETLIDECDCLWAHFPDYAGAGGRRPGGREIAGGSPAAISFLKRLRAEIDPALALLERVMEQAPGGRGTGIR
jgi:hypothetical protein